MHIVYGLVLALILHLHYVVFVCKLVCIYSNMFTVQIQWTASGIFAQTPYKK